MKSANFMSNNDTNQNKSESSQKLSRNIVITLTILTVVFYLSNALNLIDISSFLPVTGQNVAIALFISLVGYAFFAILNRLYVVHNDGKSEYNDIAERIKKEAVSEFDKISREAIQEVRELNREVVEHVYAKEVRSIDNTKDWYAKAGDIIRRHADYSIGSDKNIYAVSTFIFTNQEDVISTDREIYIHTISNTVLDDKLTYHLMIVPGSESNDRVIRAEMDARMKSMQKASDSREDRDWNSFHMNISVAQISGIDMLIVGRAVLFNIRTYSSGHPQRKGVFIDSDVISDHFRKWFLAIVADRSISRPLNEDEAKRWGINKGHFDKVQRS